MTYRPSKRKAPQFADLITILAQSKNTDPALYQTIQEIINRLNQFSDNKGNQGERGATGLPGPIQPLDESFITATTEPTLANHRRLVAGTNISLDSATPNQLTINAAGGSGGGAHAPTHSQGGADPVDVKNLAGYPGGTTQYLRADKTFAVPPTGSGGSGGMEYLGDYVAGTYNDGDIVIGADGIAYVCTKNGTTTPPEPWPGVGLPMNSGANATYWTATPHAQLTNEYALNALANGYVKSTAGVPSTVYPIPKADLPPFIAYTNIDNNFVAQTLATGSKIAGAGPTLYFNDPAAPVDYKWWRNLIYAGDFYIDAVNDPQNATVAQYKFGRDGILIASAFQGDGSRLTNIIPPGTIVIRQNACPVGWTRVAWDGKFLRVGAAFSTANGNNPTTHSHGNGTLAVPSHSHGPGTYSVAAHAHGFTVSGNASSAGGHKHNLSGNTGGESGGAMNVDGGASGNMTRSPHTHGINLDTDTIAGHTHPVNIAGATDDATAGLTGNSATQSVSLTGSTDAVSHLPPFYDVILCMKD